MSSRPPIQPLIDRVPIINPDGTPTQYFIRYLQERGIDIDGRVTPAQVAQMIGDWSANRLINTDFPLGGGGPLNADLTLFHEVSGVAAGVYGDATHVPQFNVDDEGHITGVMEVPISGGGGGGQPWYWNPPLASSFSLASGDGNSITLADDADVGMTLDYGTPVAGNLSRIAYRTLTTPANDWVMTAHFETVVFSASRLSGLMYRDPVGGRIKLFGFRFDSSDEIVRTNLTTIGAASATSTNVNIRKNAKWLRLSKSGANIAGEVSANGKQWTLIYTESATAYLAAVPSQVGFITMYASATGPNHLASCDAFSLTGTAV